MKKTLRTKKLRIHKETLRSLSSNDLEGIAAAATVACTLMKCTGAPSQCGTCPPP